MSLGSNFVGSKLNECRVVEHRPDYDVKLLNGFFLVRIAQKSGFYRIVKPDKHQNELGRVMQRK